MSLTGTQKEEAERKLKELAEEKQLEKQIKDRIKNISKRLNDKLKQLSETDEKNVNSKLTALNSQTLAQLFTSLEQKNQELVEAEENLRASKEKINKEVLNSVEDKGRYEGSIKDIKETIVKIQKAIDESVEEESNKRKKIEQDLDKSIAEIKEKILVFEKETADLEKENGEMKAKKDQILEKINGLESKFKEKAEEKDQSVKKEKEGLMDELKKVEDQVNEVTELNKVFAGIQKKNFDNKLSIYLRTKKFPDLINSFEGSATTINKCKQELTKGVNRLSKAIQTTKACEAKSKQLNDEFLVKFKIQTEKQEAIKKVKAEKEVIRGRILELQNLKKQKKEAEAGEATS